MTIHPNKLKRSEMDPYHMCNTNSDNFHISPIACNSSFTSWLSQQGVEKLLLQSTPVLNRCLLISRTEKSRLGGLFWIWKKLYYSWPCTYWPVELEWTVEVIFVNLIILQIHFSKCSLSTWGPKRPEKWLSTLCFESPGNILKTCITWAPTEEFWYNCSGVRFGCW